MVFVLSLACAVPLRAGVLRADIPVAVLKRSPFEWITEVLSVKIVVSKRGEIRSVVIRPPRAWLPTPWTFGSRDTVDGQEGWTVRSYVNDVVTADAFLRYTRIKRKTAREYQTERKIYSYSGYEDIFYPEDEGQSVVVEESDESYLSDRSASGVKRLRVERWENEDRELVMKFAPMGYNFGSSFEPNPLALLRMDGATITLKRQGRKRWKIAVATVRLVGHSDFQSVTVVGGEGRLRGRAEIDRAKFPKKGTRQTDVTKD